MHTSFFENGHLLNDSEIVLIAIKEERTVVTKDSDFLDNYLLRGAPPKVLLLEFGNIGNDSLLQLFEEYLEEVIAVFQEGSDVVLFRRTEVIGY